MRLLLTVLLAVAPWHQDSLQDKTSEQAEARANAIGAQIAQELQGMADPSWAGSYYEGDGLGVNVSLSLAPASGFLFEWHGCMGLYDRNWGAVSVEGERLRLYPERTNDRRGFQGIPEELVPVRWGARRYLIAADKILDFCNGVNSGGEPRDAVHGMFLLRRGDESVRVEGRPQLPAEFEYCLRDKPLVSRVIAVAPSVVKPFADSLKTRETVVTLDVGSADGVWKGMEFRLSYPKNRYESATVKSVREHTSEAVVSELGPRDKPPAVGWRFTVGKTR